MKEHHELMSDLKRSLENPEISDQIRLLRIEIYLKVYILVLVLCGYLLLQFLGVFGYLDVPTGRLAVGLLLFVVLNGVYLSLLNRGTHPPRLYILVALTDILFFTVLIHFLGGG